VAAQGARAGIPDDLAWLDAKAGDGPAEPGQDIGRDLFVLVAKARELGRDPEMELRAAAYRYRETRARPGAFTAVWVRFGCLSAD
jgi:hypothetical protein